MHHSGQLSSAQLAFACSLRVGRLATVDAQGRPHVVPVCYGCTSQAFYVPLDTKPKRVAPERLKRVRNLRTNPHVSLVIDHYSDDWSQLAYLLVQGIAGLLPPGDTEHGRAIELLRARYAQYQQMPIDVHPVIAVRITTAHSWGHLDRAP